MPIYEYYCDECGCAEAVLRPVSECAAPYGCYNCSSQMIRIYSAPAVLNRSKPGTFRWEQGKLNAWDDRVAHMRALETKPPREMREFRKAIGPKLYNATLRYRKEKYG